jgi:low affinity Fe/Cu permease
MRLGVVAAHEGPMTGQNHAAKTSWLSQQFSKFAQATAWGAGQPIAFLLAVVVVLVWIVTGPLFNYSDTWQLVINTGTTIVTFLMVFLIQNTQNRDILTVQLKLSELVLAMKEAENKFAAIEDLSDEELAELHEQCRRRAEHALSHIEQRKKSEAGPSAPAHDTNHKKPAAHRAKSIKRTSAARTH